MNSPDICLPIYLDQQVVFDMLAILEGGFSQLSTIKTSEIETQKTGRGGSVGANVYAFAIGGFLKKEKDNQEAREVTNERIHTPTSLFAKLRLLLQEKDLLKTVEDFETFYELESSDIVEFGAILRKNPLVDVLENMRGLLELAGIFANDNPEPPVKPNQGTPRKNSGAKQNPANTEFKQIATKLDQLINSLTQEGNSLEVYGQLLEIPELNVVLSSKIANFRDANTTEIIDSEFRVLAKVVRVVKSEDDFINLLSKTSLSILGAELLDQMFAAFNHIEDSRIALPEIITRIESPALKVIPIAIFS